MSADPRSDSDDGLRHTGDEAHDPSPQAHDNLKPVREALKGLRFGQVTIVVQDGKIIQIERTERRRLR